MTATPATETPAPAAAPSTSGRSTRRRYMPGSARSKTIELGTLSEIEEDMYQNRKDLAEPGTTKDDSYTGTIRRPSRGSVKAIARSLSEKYRAAAARKEEELLKKEAEICIERDPIQKTRQYAEEMVGVTRSFSQRIAIERRDPRTERQPSENGGFHPAEWNLPRASASEFHTRPPSVISRHGSVLTAPPALSRTSSMAGRMLIYDPRTMSLVDPALPHSSKLPDYPVPVWIPPPSPMYIPLGAPVIPFQQSGQQKYEVYQSKDSSACSEICCGGVAQLLWTIISIILVGFILVLILALFWV